jgi:hypothetical protein
LNFQTSNTTKVRNDYKTANPLSKHKSLTYPVVNAQRSTSSGPPPSRVDSEGRLQLTNDELASLRVAEVYLRSVQREIAPVAVANTVITAGEPIISNARLNNALLNAIAHGEVFDELAEATSLHTHLRLDLLHRAEDHLLGPGRDRTTLDSAGSSGDSGGAASVDNDQTPSEFQLLCAQFRGSLARSEGDLPADSLLLEPMLTVSGLTTPWTGLSACASPSWLGLSAPPSPRAENMS